MLSILIPTYNYNVYTLVAILHKECLECKINFEIIVLDDGSKSDLNIENKKINVFEFCRFEVLETNIGRSAIRNLLAKKAKFDNLLFLDSDTIPVKNNFISNYLFQISDFENVIYGGIQYQENKPSPNQLLRWVYGNKREALSLKKRTISPNLSFLTLNFLIKKSIFNKVAFNETIPNLRHEDTLFSFDLKQNKIEIKHIENPVYHLGLETSKVFIKKSEEALVGLKYLIDDKIIDSDYIRISNFYKKLEKYKLNSFIALIFKLIKPILLKQLQSIKPSLVIFDFYRLGYLCTLKK
jgi:glycosyltransferase involved in cell wall biosynthesis